MSDTSLRQRRRQALDRAIDELASLFEFGALQVATDPAGFLETVKDEIVTLRAAARARTEKEEQ